VRNHVRKEGRKKQVTLHQRALHCSVKQSKTVVNLTAIHDNPHHLIDQDLSPNLFTEKPAPVINGRCVSTFLHRFSILADGWCQVHLIDSHRLCVPLAGAFGKQFTRIDRVCRK